MNASEGNKDGADDSLSQISEALQQNLPEIDHLRSTALDNLQVVRLARAASLRSEQVRLSAKLGADHPRVAELAVRNADNEELIKGLTVENQRARVVVPKPEKETWVLHGFVYDQQLRGLSGVTVALYDASGNFAQQLGYAGTSANGSFRLEARNLADIKGPFFVHVLTSQGAHLHTDDVPLTPQAGSVVYHEIVVTGAKAGTPPGESRKDPVAEAGAWIVRGRVADKEGKGLGNLVVSLFDKDLIFDDRLGQTETDDNGEFTFTYRTEDFHDLIESNPDIYVKVLDQAGKTLYTSRKKIRYDTGRVEILSIKIDEPGKK